VRFVVKLLKVTLPISQLAAVCNSPKLPLPTERTDWHVTSEAIADDESNMSPPKTDNIMDLIEDFPFFLAPQNVDQQLDQRNGDREAREAITPPKPIPRPVSRVINWINRW
jgi:hypothetical protein